MFEDTDLIIMHIVGGTSLILCSVVLIGLMWRFFTMTTFRYEDVVIFSITLSDLLVSIGYVMATSQKDGSFGCKFQAFVTTAFPVGSAIWTTFIAYRIVELVRDADRSQEKSMLSLQYQCGIWIFIVSLGLLPLTQCTFGCTHSQTECWCVVAYLMLLLVSLALI